MVEEGEGEIAGDTEEVPHTGAREPIEQVVADGVHASGDGPPTLDGAGRCPELLQKPPARARPGGWEAPPRPKCRSYGRGNWNGVLTWANGHASEIHRGTKASSASRQASGASSAIHHDTSAAAPSGPAGSGSM